MSFSSHLSTFRIQQPVRKSVVQNESYKPRWPTQNAECFKVHQPSQTGVGSRLKEFHLFPRLPLELRLRILEIEHPTDRRQLITMILKEDTRFRGKAKKQSLQLYQLSNSLGNTISGHKYHVELRQPPQLNPLLHICRELRAIVMRRYRIRLPTKPGNGSENKRLLYIKPATDIIYLDAFNVPASVLIGFLHDLRAYDTSRKGLSNLALNTQFDNSLQILQTITPDTLEPVEIDSFRETLVELQRIWFFHLIDQGGFGMTRITTWGVPIFPEASEFNLIPSDPRPIKSYLKETLFSKQGDLQRALRRWGMMERRFGVDHTDQSQSSSPNREMSYVIAADATENHQVCVRRNHDDCKLEVVRNFRSLDSYLQADQAPFFCDFHEPRDYVEKTNMPQPTAGFWVFPPEAAEKKRGDLAGGGGTVSYNFSDKSPALGVFRLP